MKAEERILCCPFCGSLEVEVARSNVNACWIACAGCGAEATSHATREGAIQNWNRRCHQELPAIIATDDDAAWEKRAPLGRGR